MNKTLTIIGPTSSGKTELSIKLAKEFNGEIIGLDSRQIYQEMSIGTAQPTILEQQDISHHLINILSINETVSAGSYATLVKESIANILSRSKIPIICGGAGLYYRALVNGIFSGSKTDNKTRKKLENEYEKYGPKKMLSKLNKYDPDYAKSIHPNNKKRLVRALEILEFTGMSPTKNFELQKEAKQPELDLFTIYLKWDRSILKERIALRTKKMINNGWIDEVKNIVNKYPNNNLQPLDSIGYREIISYLKGDLDLENLEKTIVIKTRQFAKRQIHWFKNEKIDLQINMDSFDNNNFKDLVNNISHQII